MENETEKNNFSNREEILDAAFAQRVEKLEIKTTPFDEDINQKILTVAAYYSATFEQYENVSLRAPKNIDEFSEWCHLPEEIFKSIRHLTFTDYNNKLESYKECDLKVLKCIKELSLDDASLLTEEAIRCFMMSSFHEYVLFSYESEIYEKLDSGKKSTMLEKHLLNETSIAETYLKPLLLLKRENRITKTNVAISAGYDAFLSSVYKAILNLNRIGEFLRLEKNIDLIKKAGRKKDAAQHNLQNKCFWLYSFITGKEPTFSSNTMSLLQSEKFLKAFSVDVYGNKAGLDKLVKDRTKSFLNSPARGDVYDAATLLREELIDNSDKISVSNIFEKSIAFDRLLSANLNRLGE